MIHLISENIVITYFYIAIISTVLYVIKTVIFSFFGGDAEVHSDFNSSFETDTAFDFLSIQSILAFLMGFGWLGLACLNEWKLSLKLTLMISVLFGFLMMFLSAYLMASIKKLNKNIIKDISGCVGKIGKSYTNFAPKAEGQVEIEVNGQLAIENAINNTDKEIKSFTPIKVVKYENNKLYIEEE